VGTTVLLIRNIVLTRVDLYLFSGVYMINTQAVGCSKLTTWTEACFSASRWSLTRCLL
jgi:hypothetical protein